MGKKVSDLAGVASPGSDLIAGIGQTPLIGLNIAADIAANVQLFAKLEICNPGGSLKIAP